MLTRYHSGFHRQTGRHSLDDQHHPVLITKNNFGFPTLKQTRLISVHSFGRIFNRLRVSASHLTSDSLTVSTDLLVPINAFDFEIIHSYVEIGKNSTQPSR